MKSKRQESPLLLSPGCKSHRIPSLELNGAELSQYRLDGWTYVLFIFDD